ncbi:MAG: hypothetical protein K0U29_02965 [Gammaproteobacteria bacterium]|nr:hypothetical protein [Gammaproteobacteria bacterium]MCH9743872.1 hypothetical protein [Gammaproteobacteria bacterium]
MFPEIHKFITDFEADKFPKSDLYNELKRIERELAQATTEEKSLALISFMKENIRWPKKPDPLTHWPGLIAVIDDTMTRILEIPQVGSLGSLAKRNALDKELNMSDRLRFFAEIYSPYISCLERGLIAEVPWVTCTHPDLTKCIETITAPPFKDDQYRGGPLTADLNRSWRVMLNEKQYKATKPDEQGIILLENTNDASDTVDLAKDFKTNPTLISIIQRIAQQGGKELYRAFRPTELFDEFLTEGDIPDTNDATHQITLFADNPFKAQFFYSRKSFKSMNSYTSKPCFSPDDTPLFELEYIITIESTDEGTTFSSELSECHYRDHTATQRYHETISTLTDKANAEDAKARAKAAKKGSSGMGGKLLASWLGRRKHKQPPPNGIELDKLGAPNGHAAAAAADQPRPKSE